MTGEKASYYLRRIYGLLQHGDTVLRLRKFKGNIEGVAIDAVQYMAVDPRRNFGSTVIHECLHILYPNWCESKVLKTEEGIANTLTERQWRNLYFRLGNKLK